MENTFGNELREFNCLYKEVDEIYHEIALKMGISDSGFIILYALAELGDGCLQKDIAKIYYISKQTVNMPPSGKRPRYAYLPDASRRGTDPGKDCSGNRSGKQYICRYDPKRKQGTDQADQEVCFSFTGKSGTNIMI